MLNRPATKIELSMEADLREFEEMKNFRIQNPIEFERLFHTDNILQLLPNYQKDICLNNYSKINILIMYIRCRK